MPASCKECLHQIARRRNHWIKFLKLLGGKMPIPALVGLWPLTSYKQALRLNNEVPGIVIPPATLHEMEQAQAVADELYARWAELTEEAG